MSLRERRFGKVVSDNIAGNRGNISLIKASKRGNDSDSGEGVGLKRSRVSSQSSERQNAENEEIPKGKHCLPVKSCCKPIPEGENVESKESAAAKNIERHVRKLELGDKDSTSRTDSPMDWDTISSTTSCKALSSSVRLTRSASQKLASRPLVDPELVRIRQTVDFSDPITYYTSPSDLPALVEDFDKTQIRDTASEPHYAHDVFMYYKEKELQHIVPKYLHNQPQLKKSMRAVLVDWMVEVQESFELNHETLYLAVKMVDQYFSRKFLTKDRFQLLGATCMLMASKYDERLPASIDDFLYICDDAYARRDMILMEMDVFRTLNFFLGFPLSYRFLRRYARCAGLTMETLTLSRYILETSLMDYDLVQERESKIAAAALLLAMKMKQQTQWTASLEFYSGYRELELTALMYKLNDLIASPIKSTTKTIRTKYSHSIFYEVAKIAPLPSKR